LAGVFLSNLTLRRAHQPVQVVRYQPDLFPITKLARTTPIIPPDRPDEAVIRYVRELAKRLAREDHEAEVATRLASNPATAKSP
jgi:hypothetical protein